MAREKSGFWISLAAIVFYPVGYLTGRPRYVGREHLPETGGALIVGNHISHLDPIHTALWLHTAGRVPRFMAKNSLWSVPVLGTFVIAGLSSWWPVWLSALVVFFAMLIVTAVLALLGILRFKRIGQRQNPVQSIAQDVKEVRDEL